MEVYEMGVWAKIWRGKRKVRGDKDAYLHGLVERRGDTVGSWTFSKGWVEEWVCQGSGDVLRYTRRSPTKDGWVLVALGIRNVEVEELGSWKEVDEIWTHGMVSRESSFGLTGISRERYRWLL